MYSPKVFKVFKNPPNYHLLVEYGTLGIITSKPNELFNELLGLKFAYVLLTSGSVFTH